MISRSLLTIGLFLSFLFSGIAQSYDPQADEYFEPQCSGYYWFLDSIYNMYDLKAVANPNKDLKTVQDCESNRFIFTEGRYGFELSQDSILKDRFCTYEFVNPSKVKITNPDYEVSYVDLPHEVFRGATEIQPYTMAHTSGIILIYDFPDSTFYHIYKINYSGEVIGKLRFEHTKIDKNDNEYSYERYLYPFDAREDYLIFSGLRSYASIKKTIEIDLRSFHITEYDFNLSGVAWEDYDNTPRGYILAPGDQKFQEKSILKLYWKQDSSYRDLDIPYAGDRCAAIAWGWQIYVANYNQISTGSSLHAFDVSQKTKLWTADVQQLMVDHSKYFNKVTLIKYRNRLFMEGNEAYGNYLQVFDISTGKRLKSFGISEK